ncbi:MAG: V-type ATP synthase subunit E family protein [Candidatus Hadarchaeales archaeon]
MERGARLIAQDILGEARKKAEEILERARKEASSLVEAAEKEEKRAGEEEVEKARERARQIYEERVAKGRVEGKKELLKKKEELIEEVFRRAEERLRKYVSSKEYEKDLLDLTVEACQRLGSEEVVVEASSRDLERLKGRQDELRKRLGGVRLSFGRPLETLGGVRVRSGDGRAELDETLESRMRRGREALRVRVAKILFEGS